MKTGFVTQTFVAAYCANCESPYSDDDYPTLFTSIEEATESVTDPLVGWRVEGERITCDDCIAKAHCAEHGHDWPEWKTREWVADDGSRHRRRSRVCDHCWLVEAEDLP